MAKYLQEAPFNEAMKVLARNNKKPIKHTVWTGDFMGMCTHNIPCAVCFDNPAIIHRDCSLTARRYQTIQPCKSCQDKGYVITKLPKFITKHFWWS